MLRFSCSELGLRLIEREWYFDEYNKAELSDICVNESDDKVLEYLLLALGTMYERFIIHPTWERDYGLYSQEIDNEYKRWIFSIANRITNRSIIVRIALARIFAICRDKRAWDIYIEILPKRSAYASRVWDFCRTYAEYSMTEDQRIGLIQVFENIRQKVKRVARYCTMGIDALQSLKLDS